MPVTSRVDHPFAKPVCVQSTWVDANNAAAAKALHQNRRPCQLSTAAVTPTSKPRKSNSSMIGARTTPLRSGDANGFIGARLASSDRREDRAAGHHRNQREKNDMPPPTASDLKAQMPGDGPADHSLRDERTEKRRRRK